MTYQILPVLASLMMMAACVAPSDPGRPGAVLEGANLPAVAPGPALGNSQPPKLIRIQNPEYPERLRKQGIAGTVIVEFIIGTDGRVVSATAVQSPAADLSDLAVKAVMESVYKPALRDGKPAAVKMRVPITFNLSPNATSAPERPRIESNG